MNQLIEMLASQLGGPALQQLSQQIGANEGTTQSAIGMALPMLLSAMGAQANNNPDSAQTIYQAAQDQDDSILDNVMGFVGNAGAASMGSNLLNQVVGGGTHNAMADAIGQRTGMDSGAVNQLLGILTPLVMGVLSKSSQEQGGLDPNGIAQMLGGLSGNNDVIGMVTKAIDADGDGNIVEDIGNIIGKMF